MSKPGSRGRRVAGIAAVAVGLVTAALVARQAGPRATAPVAPAALTPEPGSEPTWIAVSGLQAEGQVRFAHAVHQGTADPKLAALGPVAVVVVSVDSRASRESWVLDLSKVAFELVDRRRVPALSPSTGPKHPPELDALFEYSEKPLMVASGDEVGPLVVLAPADLDFAKVFAVRYRRNGRDVVVPGRLYFPGDEQRPADAVTGADEPSPPDNAR